jgi:predicted RNA-binding Zn-ribbon protein involved in translation (DUF1610 family)
MKTLEQRVRARQISKLYEERHKHLCPICGKVMIWKRSSRCLSCAVKARWKEGGFEKYEYGHPGEKHWAWKKGKYISGGYVYVYKPDYTNKQGRHYIAEHRLVWEQAHGKPLPKGWHIHHLNGVRTDNRPANLVALPSRKHSLVLEAKAKRIQQLEALLKAQGQLL